ncbi:unnamed protein product [Trifolium pratense]|uniref:Uncharacterized protein n=1 Tax=Trifolium pratense TaxID=57577 RepID=A0ACB0LDV8_TRIPR|nr:unnamed protein product [Trifolium pratense]
MLIEGNVPPRLVHLSGRKRRLRTLRRSGHGKLQLCQILQSTVHPEHEATNVEIQGDDVVREMEEEVEMVQEGDESSVMKVRRPTWVNPYEGQPVPKEFPGGPLDTSVLYDYGAPHIARCIYDNKRWHGETSSFHMPSGEMTVTPDDVRCLLHLPIKGRLLDHKGIPTKTEGVELMIKHMGSTREEAEHEVKTTKGAHARFVYLKELIKKHTSVVNKAEVDGDMDTFERYKGYITRVYLLLLVGTTIFSNKAKNNVDLTYLKYFIDLDQVHTHAWGTAALPFLYQELTNATVSSCKYVAGYMTLLQTIPRHPDSAANILDTIDRIDQHWLNYTDRVLTYDMLGNCATILSDTAPGYMSWYFRISHPYYIVCISASLMQQPMHVESEAAMLCRLASIRDILNSVMHIDEVPNGSRVYNELQSAYTLTFVLNQGEPDSSSQY